MDNSPPEKPRILGGLVGGAAVAVAGLLAALALVYTNATGVTSVADEAHRQQEAESALGTTAAARNAIGQALILASTPTTGDDMVSAWIEEAQIVLTELDRRVTSTAALVPEAGGLPTAAADALTLADRVLTLVGDGDVTAAGELATTDLADAFDTLTGQIVTVRDDAALAIATAEAKAGAVATSSQFMVAFFVPLAAVGIGFFALRRRRKRERLAAELEKERGINRSKDQLIANLSHELRTPLTGIYTSALAMEEAGFSDSELSGELTGLIIDQSADLTRMVEDLLVSAQAEAGRLAFALEPTSIEAEVHAVVREFTRQGVTISLAIDDCPVWVDPGRFRQLLRNLVSNAVRHGGPGVLIQGRVSSPGYLLQVVDDGPGIPPEVESRLFERFIHRGSAPLIVGSVGLGLAITRVLAEGMGGTIAYRRHADRTIFSIRLRKESDPQPVGARAA